MKKINLVLVLLIFFSAHEITFARHIPSGFEDLYQFSERQVLLKNLDGSKSYTIELAVNYDTVKFTVNKLQTQKTLTQYFEFNQINAELSNAILQALAVGVSNDMQCRGRMDECVILTETFATLYDYDNNQLSLFINPKYLLTAPAELVYADSKNEHSALINHAAVYASSYAGQTGSYSLSDQTLLGLPYGNLRSDFNYSSRNDDKQFDLYQLSYDVESDGLRLYAGKFRNGVSFNATDFLTTNSQFEQTSVTIGSSSNLLTGEMSGYEKLYFFAPGPAELIIYRDERIIKQITVSEGQGFITYEDLPTGRYEIRVDIVVAGNVVSSEVKQIYNSANERLRLGDIDYALAVGRLDESRAFYTSADKPHAQSELDGAVLYKGLLAYRPLSSLVVGSGVIGAADSYAGQFGAQVYLPLNMRSNLVTTYFDSGSNHLDLLFSTDYFAVQYENFTNNDVDVNKSLASYMYGDRDYNRFSFSTSYRFNSINSYFIYSQGKRSDVDRYNVEDILGVSVGYQYRSITAGFNMPWFANSILDFSIDYQDTNDNLSATINWSVPLSTTMSAHSTLYANKDALQQAKVAVKADNVLPFSNVNSSVQLGQSYFNRDESSNVSEAMLTASTRQAQWQASGYSYADTNNELGFSGNVSSTQVITGNSVNFTSDKADAYVSVDIDAQESDDSYGFMTLRRNGKLQNKSFIYDKKSLIGLNSYDSYDVNLDTESVALHNSGDSSFTGFSLPGTVAKVKPNLRPIVSFISSFSDVFDQTIANIKCNGVGCVDVQKLMDGVFKVSLMEGLPFELVSDNNKCIVPKRYERADTLNFGSNFCLPDIAPLTKVSLLNEGELTQLYYLGIFERNKVISSHITNLASHGDKLIRKSIGDDEAIFLQTPNAQADISAEMKQAIEVLLLLAKNDVESRIIYQPIAKYTPVKGD